MSETKTKQAEARSTGGDEIEMEVVRVQDLPEKFRPPSSRKPTTADPVTNAVADLPGPIVDLIREATSELTDSERRAFIHRLKRETPELFSGGNAQHGQGPWADVPKSHRKDKWRELLINQLKQQANRFMAAAAGL